MNHQKSPTDPDDATSAQSGTMESSRGTALKLATVSPGSLSIQDGSLPGIDERPPREDQGSAQAERDAYLGCTIDGRYKVESVLGEGGMGIVYRCRHKIIDKVVAMKILRADLARDPEVTERFLIEAKAASAIGNEHIIDISDFGQLPDGSTYFVMEYLGGQPLADLIVEGQPMPVKRLVHIAKQLTEGLAAAHESDIIHRDLKPDNIFLVERGKEPDFVKILDFGIAKVSTAEHGLTRAGAVFGTPHYMSPEQAAGAPIDLRGDIYSLGVILYELASGKVPFDADNFMGILTQHMYKAPVPFRALLPEPQDVPPGLEAIVLKCLSKRPEQRYRDMTELLEDLSKLDEGIIPNAVPEMMNRSGGFHVPTDYFKKGGMPAPVPAAPNSGRSKWPMYAGLGGVVAAIVLVITIFAISEDSSAASGNKATQETASTAPPAVTVAATPAPTQAPEAEDLALTTQVLIAIAPLEARIYRGKEDLGTSPITLEVPEGETWKLAIRADGYAEQTVELDGSKPRISLQLDRAKPVRRHYGGGRPKTKSAGAKPKVKAKAKSKAKLGGSDIVNPWN